MARVSPRIRDAVLKVEATPTEVSGSRTAFRQSDRDYILAQIDGFAVLGPNRWAYAWSKTYLTTARAAAVDDTGASGTVSDNFAINIVELNNTGTGVEGHGVNVDGDDYPDGFEVQPIGGRQSFDPADPGYLLIAKNQPVRLYFDYLEDGTVQPTFERLNIDDGTCEAPA